MEAIPIATFWGLAFLGLFGKPHVLLYLLFGSMPFGAFAVIPPELTGGLTLTPTPMVAVLIILRSLFANGGVDFFAAIAFKQKGLLLLTLFWLVAVFTTIFMPTFFQGGVVIIPVRLLDSSFGEFLEPTTQNFSQLTYLTVSVLAVFAFARQLYEPAQCQHALAAMCFGGMVAVLTGVMDYLNQYVGLDAILEPFRTATYALLTEVEILGGKRVVGLMPEASSFGGVCIGFLSMIYFFRHAMANSWLRERAVPVLVFSLVVFIWLSTSSSAYVSLFVFVLVALLEWILRKRAASQSFGFEFWAVSLALIGLGFVLLFNVALLDPIIDIVDEMILSKTSSFSYEERSMWTATGWQALRDTWGWGVGVGSTRTSNFAAAVFSNTGVIGGVLFFSFFVQTIRRKPLSGENGKSSALLSGMRFALIPAFVGGLLAGTTPDFGPYNAFLYGLALAIVLHDASKGSFDSQLQTVDGRNQVSAPGIHP